MVGPFILMYHSIADIPEDPYSVTVDAFQKQISWLADNGYEVISLSFLLESINAGNYKTLRKKVVITFDDGYKDFITNALPILADHGASATVFLVTEMFEGSASWNESGEPEQLMSEDDARYIKSRGITLGSHTATHANLALLDNDELHRELRDSKATLDRLGEVFFAISYPWGQWSNQVVDAVKASGYECALAVGDHTRLNADNSFFLPRVTMTRDMTLKRFQDFMSRTRMEMNIRWGYRLMRKSMACRTALIGDN